MQSRRKSVLCPNTSSSYKFITITRECCTLQACTYSTSSRFASFGWARKSLSPRSLLPIGWLPMLSFPSTSKARSDCAACPSTSCSMGMSLRCLRMHLSSGRDSISPVKIRRARARRFRRKMAKTVTKRRSQPGRWSFPRSRVSWQQRPSSLRRTG